MINAQYGNIGDIVGNAATAYQAQLGGAQQRAQSATDWYKQMVSEQQFQQQEKRLGAADSGFDPSAILQAILAQNQPQPTQERPPIESFDQPEQTQGKRAPIQQQIPALPQAGFSVGLPKSFGEYGERAKAWGELIWKGLTGG